MALICFFMASCASTDYKALAEKAEKNPASLTQSDYSEMLDYMDAFLEKNKSLSDEEGLKLLEDENEPFGVFTMETAAAAYGLGDGPAMDEKNKAKYEKYMQKARALE